MQILRYKFLAIISFAASITAYAADSPEKPDNGTDPTRFSTTATIQYEHIDLQEGFNANTLKLSYIQPLGAAARTNLRLQMPVVSNDILGNNAYAIGDFSLKMNHVYDVNQQRGIVIGGELVFDTAHRDELGTGKNVFKGTYIYAKFLKGGAIFAPAIVHSVSFSGQDLRARVNNTVLDFYYVPHFVNPKVFMTIDPAISLDWETDKQFASLAVTAGYALGSAFGGSSQIFVKPSIFAGNERSANWGLEVGYKVIGF